MDPQTIFPTINLPKTGKNIEALRKARGFSVKELQAYFGFEYPQAIYKWQHGECLPTVDNLLALSRLLKVSMEDLLVTNDQEAVFLSRGNIRWLKSRNAAAWRKVSFPPIFLPKPGIIVV